MRSAALGDFRFWPFGPNGCCVTLLNGSIMSTRLERELALALDYFAYRVGLHAGMLAAALGGLDAFVFTAGIGENSPSLRARIVERLAWLGGTLDATANESGRTSISGRGSRVAIYVVPTDEELMIARHTLAVLATQNAAICTS
jgi:acetate kinase